MWAMEIMQQSPVRHERFRAVYSRFPKSDNLPIDKLPTVRMPAVAPATPKDRLPRDAEGRQYLQACEPGASTDVLVRQCVDLFHGLTGEYPAIIALSRDRYALFGEESQYYELGDGHKIYYTYESGDSYDVLVRDKSAFTIDEEDDQL